MTKPIQNHDPYQDLKLAIVAALDEAHVPSEAFDDAPRPEHAPFLGEAVGAITAAIRDLPPRPRKLVAYMVAHECSVLQAAKALEPSASSNHSAVTTSRQAVRTRLADVWRSSSLVTAMSPRTGKIYMKQDN